MAGVLRFLSGMVLSGAGLIDINTFLSVIEVG